MGNLLLLGQTVTQNMLLTHKGKKIFFVRKKKIRFVAALDLITDIARAMHTYFRVTILYKYIALVATDFPCSAPRGKTSVIPAVTNIDMIDGGIAHY